MSGRFAVPNDNSQAIYHWIALIYTSILTPCGDLQTLGFWQFWG